MVWSVDFRALTLLWTLQIFVFILPSLWGPCAVESESKSSEIREENVRVGARERGSKELALESRRKLVKEKNCRNDFPETILDVA
ncbi:hypothetical protein CEXT_660181 [Caerostris extrusa]|uniref:Secreted protein n=1 Tax=Caerostris extrusa TaxID=172846 RepID=A0AAV4N6P1_CAEEX|nr:hypothetical protein CEXT_660181 [Caerostris extrusa]